MTMRTDQVQDVPSAPSCVRSGLSERRRGFRWYGGFDQVPKVRSAEHNALDLLRPCGGKLDHPNVRAVECI